MTSKAWNKHYFVQKLECDIKKTIILKKPVTTMRY